MLLSRVLDQHPALFFGSGSGRREAGRHIATRLLVRVRWGLVGPGSSAPIAECLSWWETLHCAAAHDLSDSGGRCMPQLPTCASLTRNRRLASQARALTGRSPASRLSNFDIRGQISAGMIVFSIGYQERNCFGRRTPCSIFVTFARVSPASPPSRM